MADKKTITVFGATGAQGGGLVRAILKDTNGRFRVRAVTRDINSDKAQVLGALGAELVAADLDDPKSLDRVFADAYGAYCVTFYWAHFSPERETAEARALADAARRAGTQHVVWSTLEDTRKWVPLSDNRMPTLMGHYKVPHFDSKGEADAAFAALPATLFLTSFYWDNLIDSGSGPKKGADGTLEFTLPMDDKKLPGICRGHRQVRLRHLQEGHRARRQDGRRGRRPPHRGADGRVSLLALGQPVRHSNPSPQVHPAASGFPGPRILGNMFQFKRDFESYYCGARSLEVSRGLNPELQTFDQWLDANKGRIPLA